MSSLCNTIDYSLFCTQTYVKVIDKLLLEHVGLPHVLVLAVHLVNLFGLIGKGDHSKTFVLFALKCCSAP